jgi:hypothetical protein
MLDVVSCNHGKMDTSMRSFLSATPTDGLRRAVASDISESSFCSAKRATYTHYYQRHTRKKTSSLKFTYLLEITAPAHTEKKRASYNPAAMRNMREVVFSFSLFAL